MNMEEQRKRINGLTGKALEALQKEFLVIGKRHIKVWHAWLALGVVAGIVGGVLLVANRSGKFEKIMAQQFSLEDTLEDTIEVYISNTPSNILSANPISGNQRAELFLEGVSQTNPSFTVTAEVVYDDSANPRWTINNVNYSSIPSGYTPPQILIDNGSNFSFNGYTLQFVAVKSGGADVYRMTWRISGTATSDVAPVLLPRFVSFPWRDQKKGYVIKAQDIENPNGGSNDPYGPDDINLKSSLDSLTDAIERMSNHAIQASYEIKEASHGMPNNPSGLEMTKAALQSLGIDRTNYNAAFDWVVYTMYTSAFPGYNRTPNGMFPLSDDCPQCGPGAIYMDITWGAPLRDKTTLLHEFGHGLGFSHPEVNLGCENAEGIIRIEDIFNECSQTSRDHDNNMGAGVGFWWSPIERAILGWLKGTQVTLVTESGIYDVYSDNADFTSSPDKPLILQILTEFDGQADFLYITVPNVANVNSIDDANINEEERTYLSQGIQLSAANADPRSGGRHGLSRFSMNELVYSNNSNNSDLREAIVKNTIQPGEEVHVKSGKAGIIIKHLERAGDRATVSVTLPPDID